MNIIQENFYTIAQIPLGLKNISIESQYVDGADLYIPLNLSTCDTSALDIALCEENEVDYCELEGQFVYELNFNITDNKSTWFLNVMTEDFGTVFQIEFDKNEEVLLMYAIMQHSILTNTAVGGAL